MSLKERIGDLWGKTTTILLGVGVTVQGILSDPGAQAFVATVPWAPKVIAGLGLLIVILRVVTPPPPSLPMPEGTQATKLDANTIVISTPDALPAAVVAAEKTMPDVPLASP